MSQEINIDCPFSNYTNCAIKEILDVPVERCIMVGRWDEDSESYEISDEYCPVQSTFRTWTNRLPF